SARLALGVSRDFLKQPLPAAGLAGGTARSARALHHGHLAAPQRAARDRAGRTSRPACVLDQAERAAVQRALARSNGNVSAAAEALGISRATLHRKLRRLDLNRAH